MKKYFTLLTLAIMFSLAAFQATAFNSLLQISSTCNPYITVQIGHVRYNNPTTMFQLNSLTPGTYNIQVYGWNRMLVNQVPIYNGIISIGYNEVVNTVITAFGIAQITHQQLVPQCQPSRPVNQPFQNNYNYNYNYGYTYQDNYGYGTTQNCQYNGWIPMDMNAFNMLKQSIMNASFESTKKDIVHQAIAQQYFTAVQLRDLLQLFSFESTKVEVAKLAYPHVLDKQNIYSIYDVFSFNSSISQLSRFFSQQN